MLSIYSTQANQLVGKENKLNIQIFFSEVAGDYKRKNTELTFIKLSETTSVAHASL